MEKTLCPDCKNYFGALRCKAFPEMIPPEITIGENDHSSPLPGQGNDIVFEPKVVITKKEMPKIGG